MHHFPECHRKVDDSEAAYGPAKPTRRDSILKTAQAGLLRSIKQEIVIRPIAEAERVIPRQHRENYAHFKTKQDIKDNTQPRSHKTTVLRDRFRYPGWILHWNEGFSLFNRTLGLEVSQPVSHTSVRDADTINFGEDFNGGVYLAHLLVREAQIIA